jgi:hypothetical protein
MVFSGLEFHHFSTLFSSYCSDYGSCMGSQLQRHLLSICCVPGTTTALGIQRWIKYSHFKKGLVCGQQHEQIPEMTGFYYTAWLLAFSLYRVEKIKQMSKCKIEGISTAQVFHPNLSCGVSRVDVIMSNMYCLTCIHEESVKITLLVNLIWHMFHWDSSAYNSMRGMRLAF